MTKMPVSTGIRDHGSRFAALQVDSFSESEDEEPWKRVGSVDKPKPKPRSQGQGQEGGEGGKGGLSKNAKKRAKKKRNQESASSESADGNVHSGQVKPTVDGEWQQWQETDEVLLDQKFHKDLEEALLQSTLEAERTAKLDKERKAALAEARGLSAKTGKSKKGITLTLQELHRGAVASPPSPKETQSPKFFAQELLTSPQFFDKIGEEAQTEMRRSQEIKTSESIQSPTLLHSPTTVEESARVAQVMDELEKRDKAIARLKKENELLKKGMKEVKERNRSLCKILSQGEFSTKAQLLEQLEDLSSVKNELTLEISSMHTLLEQERSKNKAFKAEVARLQAIVAKGTKTANQS